MLMAIDDTLLRFCTGPEVRTVKDWADHEANVTEARMIKTIGRAIPNSIRRKNNERPD
jgi:hypothetical protein